MLNFKSTHDIQYHTVNIGVYSESGFGKTRLCATTGCPDQTLIVSCEGGLLSLRNEKMTAVEVRSLEEMREVYRFLKSPEGQKYKWLCIDSVTEFAKIVLKEMKEELKDGRQYWNAAAEKVSAIITEFRDLPLNVYFIFQAKRIQTDTGAMLWSPEVPGNALKHSVPHDLDEMLALRTHRQETEDGGFETVRWLQCQPDGVYTAKDRSGALALHEAPSLENIANKILGVKQDG